MTTATIDRSIELDCSKHDAYERLSQVEAYSQFSDIAEVASRGANMAHVVADYKGKREEFDLALDRVPEERITWRSLSGPLVESQISLQKLDDQHTQLQLHVEYDQEQLTDKYKIGPQEVEQRTQDRLRGLKSLAEGKASGS